MPVRVPDNLPAIATLQEENIFVMTEKRAVHQDIRPLRILVLNLMPTKIITETQLLRVLGNTPLQVDVTFLRPSEHISKNTPLEHMLTFYRTFDEVRDQKFDGFLMTGAPVEDMPFEEVNYWQELTEIMDWAKQNVFSTFYICWGAQAGLYHYYGVPKYPLPEKMFGVFRHSTTAEVRKHTRLMRGFDDVFYAPHSRHTECRSEDIRAVPELQVVCESEEAGVFIVSSRDGRHLFVMGHCEYDADTLGREYWRDVERGLPIKVPRNYYPDDDPNQPPMARWRAHGHLMFSNWLNYCVYQETPFDISTI